MRVSLDVQIGRETLSRRGRPGEVRTEETNCASGDDGWDGARPGVAGDAADGRQGGESVGGDLKVLGCLRTGVLVSACPASAAIALEQPYHVCYLSFRFTQRNGCEYLKQCRKFDRSEGTV